MDIGSVGESHPNIFSSRKILMQLENEACLEKPVYYIASPTRLEFSYCHSCLSLSDCNSYWSLLSVIEFSDRTLIFGLLRPFSTVLANVFKFI